MQEIGSAIREKSLTQLKYCKKHYQQVYPHAKQKGKVVLRYYLKKLNRQIQKQQGNLLINS
jgi:hypothetical protein